MDPKVIKLESMKIAAELLCCAQQGGGSLPSNFPESADGDQEASFERLFFALSEKIFQEVEHNTF